jgi:pSer/pThr/pTyr-binding forkhead associated (FHA) protein
MRNQPQQVGESGRGAQTNKLTVSDGKIMKALLVVQEGPGAGRSYPLDPSKQILLSAGRSADCNIVLQDHRASRYHADFRWNGHVWEVADHGSTNGTYVNGMQVHQPYDLRVGDRVTIGETTLVLREWEGLAPRAAPAPPLARRAAGTPASAGTAVAFWFAQALIVASIVSLASGAFLPWLQVTGSLSQDMEPLVKSITDIISSVMGSDFLFVTQQVSGLEGYGKLTLGIAVIALVVLVVDLFFYRQSVVPGIVYTLAGLLAAGAMAADLKNLYDIYNQVQSVSLLFGIKLSQVIEVFDKFLQVKVTPLPGLYLTAAGLGLLLVGGFGRLAVALLERRK